MSGDPTEPFLSDVDSRDDDEEPSQNGFNNNRRRYGERFAPPSVVVSETTFSGEQAREVGQRDQGSSPSTGSKRQLHRLQRSKRKSSTVAPRARYGMCASSIIVLAVCMYPCTGGWGGFAWIPMGEGRI